MICFLVCIFLLFNVSTGMAEERKERRENSFGRNHRHRHPDYSNPVTPIDTRYGTQYNLVTEEQIKEQNSYDFESTLRDVPGVMFQSKNLIGEQTSHSLYIRGRGASHPSPDFAIEFDGVPRFGALFGQVLGDGIAISPPSGG